MPKQIFGTKRGELIASWRKLHNENLLNLCSSPNTINIKSNRMKRAFMEEKTNAYKVLVRKPKGKR
jgi:hypothetical protein